MVCYTIAQCIKIQNIFDEIVFIPKGIISERRHCLYKNSYTNMIYNNHSQINEKNTKKKVTKLNATFTPSVTKKTE